MAKSNRGSGIRDQVKRARGTCPLCKRTGIKLLRAREINEKKVSICKQCDGAMKNGTKKAS